MSKRLTLSMLALALVLALACSSSNTDGGSLDAALGAQMSELSDLGDRFVGGENEATYDTLGDASSLIGDALEGGLQAASTVSKQAGCLPESLAGATLLVDVQSNTFTPGAPSGLPDAVQFRLLSDPQTEVGYVNVTCAGVLPSISVNISVNTTDDIEVLNLTASQISVSPPSFFNASLSGTLRSADGDAVPFGMFSFDSSSGLGLDANSLFATTAFQISDTGVAFVEQELFTDPSFPFERIRLGVEDSPDPSPDGFGCDALFDYEANMEGTPGAVLGGGVFCASPPLGDDFLYHVNCNQGTFDNLVVTPADLACQANAFFEGDATQLSGAVLAAIQEATDALLSMHSAVISVAQAGAAVALKLAEAQQQPQF